MNDKIVAIINRAAADLASSNKTTVQHLLAQFDHQKLFNTVSELMRDPALERKAWIICINTLCHIDPIEANKRFITALQTDDADKRYRIVRMLRGCGTYPIVSTLIDMLKTEPEPGIRTMVAHALGAIGDKQALPALEWSAANDHAVDHEGRRVSGFAKDAIEELRQTP